MLIRCASALLGFSTVALLAEPIPDVLRMDEGGRAREYVVATDEGHDGRKVEKVAPQRNAEGLRAILRGARENLVLYPKGAPHDAGNRRLLTRDIAVRLQAGAKIEAVAAAAGVAVVRQLPVGRDWWLVRASLEPGSAIDSARALRRDRSVLVAHLQLAREKSRRFTPNDPFLSNQWHIDNSGQEAGVPGIDANLKPAWNIATGAGVTLAIVDDGLEHTHPDLMPHYRADLSFDFNYHDLDPMPAPFIGDVHGTSCAGLAAATGNNGIGVAGAAFNADLVGLRLISLPTTDADEAECFLFENDVIDIKSNSWGPFDNGKALEGAGPLALAAIRDAVENGRNGKGTIFVWAGGNGNDRGDDSNYDGYANLRETIAVGAYTNIDDAARYSEGGSNLVVTAPSSGGTLGITTTDARGTDGYNFGSPRNLPDPDYTDDFGGTSAACPLVAGIAALMLEARPELGWRDVQQILIDTARKVRPNDPQWVTNAAGKHFHPRFGAGLVDAAAAVNAAKQTDLLGPNVSFSHEDSVPAPIPDAKKNSSAGVSKTFNFSDAPLRVEHAVVTVDIAHGARGQLEIKLRSPSGVESVLAPVRKADKGRDYLSWSFMTVQFWGESANAATGMWTVTVTDRIKGQTGSVNKVKVELFGTSDINNVRVESALVTNTTNGDADAQPGETVTAEITLRNDALTDIANLGTALMQTTGVTGATDVVNRGALASGDTTTFAFTFQAAGAIGSTITPTFLLTDGQKQLGTASFPIILGHHGTALSEYGSLIEVPRYPKRKGNGDPYPGRALVSSVPLNAVITKVRLFMDHLGSGKTDEIDALLVSPSGKSVIVLSDAGAEGADDVSLVISDEALLPINGTHYFTSGEYRPTNFGPGVDAFPSPAPSGVHGANMADFNGGAPNGLWELYLRDDGGRRFSALGSWHVEVEYAY